MDERALTKYALRQWRDDVYQALAAIEYNQRQLPFQTAYQIGDRVR